MLTIFYVSIFIILYHLIFYVFIVKLFRKKEENLSELIEFPTITILCPAYNEAEVIEEKIKSYFNLDYPKDKLKMIVISDDSTDGTNEIVQKYVEKDYLELVVQKPRKGKVSGHNLIEPSIKSEYVLSTDANSLFEPQAVKELVKMIKSNSNIGLVTGTLKLKKKNSADSGEGLYWKYESYIKKMESDFYSVLGSNGSIFLIKRELFTKMHPSSVDDFERTLQVLNNGFIGKYCPNSIVYEEVTENPSEELKRKIRIISREWFALERNISLLNPSKFPKISWMLFSHKLIRWLFFLWSILIFISNIFLMKLNIFFMITFVVQTLGYTLGAIEIILEKTGKSNKLMKIPAYFVVMFYASLMGFIKYLKREQAATWNTIREEN
jgi:cellulose synthase/poly-beta-1,6-N-acetylglucosamine synthase-like glycosyltransferase